MNAKTKPIPPRRSADKVSRLFSQVKPTTCLLYSIPTSLWKTFVWVFEGQNPLKQPWVKRSSLEPNTPQLLSHIQLWNFFWKNCLSIDTIDFLNSNNNLEKYLSGFRVKHSTALLKILKYFRCNTDSQRLSVLVLLDFSAAVDTVDHHTLFNRLWHLVGLSGTVNWFHSYVNNRHFFVSMDICSSRTHWTLCGAPQG